ncbi:unnamed protein product [Urochloa decumbens]|uniref:Uncharacterized protein n=1 Tax=Urochloa decumbens TaxID=240449 RepID=A0ABC9A0X0_9POAL
MQTSVNNAASGGTDGPELGHNQEPADQQGEVNQNAASPVNVAEADLNPETEMHQNDPVPLQMIVPSITSTFADKTLSDMEVISALNLLVSIPRSLLNLSLYHISIIDLDLDMIIPPYFTDKSILFHLARVALDEQPTPVVLGPVLPPTGTPLVPYSDSEDEDDVVEVVGAQSTTPKRRRARHPREQLEDVFCRRSKRLNPNLGGFRTAASVAEVADNPSVYMVGPSTAEVAAPHLSIQNIQGLATGYLQIPPDAVSAAVLLELDNE